ncbi:MAG: DNA polymerase III subunit epsilon [Alphaproteobacteria bacterium]
MREIVLDVETTGLSAKNGNRIVEIAGIEVINYVPTGKYFQAYVNPERESDADAFKVHNLTTEFLSQKPLFKEIASDFLEFIKDSPLVIHNAPFDMSFIQNELKIAGLPILQNKIVDTLEIARKAFPGISNSLDSLCKRFNIDISEREIHAALLDVELLAKVYLELMGGSQTKMTFAVNEECNVKSEKKFYPPRPHFPSEDELDAHKKMFSDNYMWCWKNDLEKMPLKDFMLKHNLERFFPAFFNEEYKLFTDLSIKALGDTGNASEARLFCLLEALIKKHRIENLKNILDKIRNKQPI